MLENLGEKCNFQVILYFLQLDEVCAYGAGEAMGTLVSSGEPQQIIVAGDPRQLTPRSTSKTAGLLYGKITLVDLLKKNPDYFDLSNEYVQLDT
jgi:hypothetical protein